VTHTDVGTHAATSAKPPLRVLLVEDSRCDAALTLAALRDCVRPPEVHVAQDGEAAMDFLLREGPHADAPHVDLVLLDLNLPRMDGREVLQAMKGHDVLRTIPVIVLTSSSADADVRAAYRLHANAYVTKPVGFDAFLVAMKGIEEFWMTLVRLPDLSE
jgi:CheY-like chemotaxis protein